MIPSNGYQQGLYTPKNPQKYSGDVGNIVYRSSYELKFMKWCDFNPSVVLWSSETIIVPYLSPMDNKMHRYFVDFAITVKDKEGDINRYLIEIKPKKQTVPPKERKKKTKTYIHECTTYAINQAKWKAADAFARKNNSKFLVLTEENLGIK